MNGMLERLDASSATLSRFVSDSSHEIRSPITNIRARIETSSADDWDATRSDIVGEVERIEALIGDLTSLARSDEGRVGQHIERVDLDEVLFAEAARLQQRGRVSVDASGVEPFAIIGDRGQLRRVVRNLVDNAERHATSAVALTLRAQVSGGDDVIIVVDDDGRGIAAEDRARVFERFARLDESRDRGAGGTGLGLAIVADIVARHAGSIDIDTSTLGGASFRVLLPSAPPPSG